MDRMKALETKIRINREIKKEIKAQKYRSFLHEQTGYLPSRQKIQRWKKYFLLGATICLVVISVQTCFFYNTIWAPPQKLYHDTQQISLEQIWGALLNETPTIFGSLFIILGSFGMALDKATYRRWGNQYTIINW